MICPGRGFSLLNDLPRTSPPQILKDHLPPTPDWRAAVCRGLFGVTQSLGRSQRNTAESSWRPLFSLPHSLQKWGWSGCLAQSTSYGTRCQLWRSWRSGAEMEGPGRDHAVASLTCGIIRAPCLRKPHPDKGYKILTSDTKLSPWPTDWSGIKCSRSQYLNGWVRMENVNNSGHFLIVGWIYLEKIQHFL